MDMYTDEEKLAVRRAVARQTLTRAGGMTGLVLGLLMWAVVALVSWSLLGWLAEIVAG